MAYGKTEMIQAMGSVLKSVAELERSVEEGTEDGDGKRRHWRIVSSGRKGERKEGRME